MAIAKTTHVRLGIFILASLILLAFTVYSTPTRRGDGHEYSVIAQAFLNHLSPDIKSEDITVRSEQTDSFLNNDYSKEVFAAMKDVISSGRIDKPGWGLFYAKNDAYYGFHFWLYPAYVAGVEVIANAIGANPLASFQIANGLLFMVVIAYCLFRVKVSLVRQIAIISAFTLGGPLFYLKWTHPEFLIATFLFLGFIALYQRSFRVVFLCFALAAIQVVTLWTVFAAIPLLLFLQNKSRFSQEIGLLSKHWWAWFCCLLPATSLLFYYIHFGKISLIGDLCTDMGLVTWSHLYSFWFDLDQGVVVGVPWLLPVLLVFLLRIKSSSTQCRLDFYIAVFAGLCICVPLLAQNSVNAGQSVFQRYALYAVCPLTAWAGYYFVDLINKRWLQLLVLFSAAGYATTFSGANVDENPYSHKPWTQLILEYFSDYYNPEPGIFYARTRHDGPTEWFRYTTDHIVIYKNRQGQIRKVLFPMNNTKKAVSTFCLGQLIDAQGSPVDFTKGTHEAYGWAYLNGIMHCDGLELDTVINLQPQYSVPLSSGLDFSHEGFPEWVELASGLSVYESNGRWSEGRSVVLKIKATLPERFNLTMWVGAFADNVGKPVTVSVNGVSNSFVADSDTLKSYSIKFELEHPVTEAIIKISIAHPISPQQLGLSNDSRQLGLYFSKIGFDF